MLLHVLKALCHSDESGWTDVEDISTVSDLRADPDSLVWAELDIADLSEGDQATIAEEFDLDRYAVEDAVNPRQRPKLESYESHLFLVVHQLDEERHQLEQRQISCFVGQSYVLVIHEGAARTLKETRRRLGELNKIEGPARLIHALVDTVVDDYESIADSLEIDIEELEERALRASSETQDGRDRARLPDQRQLYRVKQQVSRLRRFALPLTRVLERVVNQADPRVPNEATMKMFRDVYDHTLRNQAQVDNIDELASAVIDLTRGEQADTLNEINKKLTAWAAIIAAPTLITGFYGMNVLLEPHAGTGAGLIVASVLMIGSVVALYINFRKRGWL